MRTPNFDEDNETFSADAYTVARHGGVAWYVRGWETEPVSVWFCSDCSRTGYERNGGGGAVTDPGDSDCEHSHCHYSDDPDEIRTGRIVCVMVGDDRQFTFDPEDVTPLAREEYCGECGQIGCAHDGLDRTEED